MPPVRSGGVFVARRNARQAELHLHTANEVPRTRRGGIHLVVSAHVSRSRLANSRVLRWLFRRGNRFLSLELGHAPGGAYTFSLTPLGSDARGVETIDTGVSAFERHEAIAAQLRQSGWKVVAFTAHRGQPSRSRSAPILERS
jgi:hypothetical protein